MSGLDSLTMVEFMKRCENVSIGQIKCQNYEICLQLVIAKFKITLLI